MGILVTQVPPVIDDSKKSGHEIYENRIVIRECIIPREARRNNYACS